jgi:hypothetical protein
MLRTFVGSLALVFLVGGLVLADDKNNQDKNKPKGEEHKAKITKVDAKNHEISVKFMKNGKETEEKFKLTEDIEYLDSTGRVAQLDLFRSGDDVLIIEREGKLVRVKHQKEHKDRTKASTGTAPDKKPVNK